MSRIRIALVAVPLAAIIGLAATDVPVGAAVRTHDVNLTRTCTRGSLGNLQLQREDNGTISLDFGVDMSRHIAGVPWKVHVTDNTSTVVTATVRTGTDGSFSITRSLPRAASSHVVAWAKNTVTGEVCSISATM